MKIQITKIFDIFLIVLLSMFLFYLYPTFVHKNYLYLGFDYAFDKQRFVIAIFTFAFLLLLNTRLKDFGYFVSTLFLILLFVPNMIMFVVYPNFYKEIFISIFLFQFFLILAFSVRFTNTQIVFPTFDDSSKVVIILIISLIALFPFFLKFRLNLNFKVLLLQNIYDVRLENTKHFNVLMTYFYSWLAKIIFPVGMLLALQLKQKNLFIFLFVAELYLFLVAGHKSVFLSLFLVVFFFTKDYYKQTTFLLLGILIVIFLGFLLWKIKGNLVYESIFVRRMFFVPALLNQYYFEFFSGDKLFLGHSIFKSFISYPYDLVPSRMIGKTYFDNPLTNANNGFIADGYINFGFWGIAIYSLIVIMYFKILQHLNLSHKFSGVFIIIIFTLISSALTTAFVSHGLLLFLFIAMFLLYDSGKKFESGKLQP